MKRGLTTLFLISASGCFYSFDNPVELQDAGSIAGHVVFTDAGTGLTPGGGQVGLLWTDLSITVRDDGRFLFLGLPDGVYTVKYELDPGDGGLPLIAYLPGVTLPQEPGNIPDAIDLGTIVLNPVARVTGHVTGLGDAGGAVVGAFAPGDAGEIFESFTVMTDADGNFTLDLPAGAHDLWASTNSVSGSVPVSVPSGQVTDLGDLPLVPPPPPPGSRGQPHQGRSDPNTGDPNGELVGDVVLGLPGLGAHADPAAVADAGLVQGNVEIDPPPPPEDPLTLGTQQVGVGVHMNQTLPPGQIYPTIYCGLKGKQPPGPETLNDIGLTGIPTFVGHPTILGQITWLPVGTFAANNQPAPPNYATSTTSGAATTGTSSGGATSSGGSTGGSSTGGASTGGIGSSTGGPQVDAGLPPHWQDMAEAVVADGGTDYGYDPFIPVPVDGGQVVYYTNNYILYLAQVTDGGLNPLMTLDTGGGTVELLAAATDELGIPTAIVSYYLPLTQGSSLTVVQPGPKNQWQLSTCFPFYYQGYGQAALLAAPPGSAEANGPSMYAFFFDYSSELNIGAVYAQGGGCNYLPVNTPTSGDAGAGQYQFVYPAACTLKGNPGACLALGGYGNFVDAVGIDLTNPPNTLTEPLNLWTGPVGAYVPLGVSAVVTGPPSAEVFTATWYEGYVDPAPGDLVAQRTPVFYLEDQSGGVSLPPPVAFDAGFDQDAGQSLYSFQSTLALSSRDVPFVLAQGRSNIVSTNVPPLQNFAFDLISGAPFQDVPADAGVASRPYGYVDANGNPVVGFAADDLTTLHAQVWTYAP